MESLLRWGIENSATEADSEAPQPPPRDISKLDPGIIDAILGKPDSVKMKEALGVALDESVPEDARLIALDDFEMLIESIDNANDITSMKMWEPLIGLLSSPSDAIRMNTLWILGTAIQNNPKAQTAFLSHAPLSKVLYLLQPNLVDHTAQTRSKAVYCLSASLRHNRAAVEGLEALQGWQVLKGGLTDPDPTVRRKVAFLLNALLLPDNSDDQVLTTTTHDLTRDALQKHGITSVLVAGLADPHDADDDLEEKSARALLSYLEIEGRLETADSSKLLSKLKELQGKPFWGLAKEERDSLQRFVSGSA